MNNVNDQLAASQRAFDLAAQGNGGYQDPASFGYNPSFNTGFNPGYNAGFPQGDFQQAGYEGGGSNPQNSPNVDVHGPAPSGGDGKFYEVSSSSFSSSSNVNGKPTSHRTSHTTINDNGKITEHNVST